MGRRIQITEEDLGLEPTAAPAPAPQAAPKHAALPPLAAPPTPTQIVVDQPAPAAPVPYVAPQEPPTAVHPAPGTPVPMSVDPSTGVAWPAPPPGPPGPPVAALPAPPSEGGRRRWLPYALGGGLLALIAIAVGIVLLTSGPSADEEYQATVRSAIDPVAEADANLATALRGLDGDSASGATAAVTSARSALEDARSIMSSTEAPDSSAELLADAKGALSDQGTYLDAVSAVLRRPAAGARSAVATVEQSLSRSLDGLAVPGTDWGGSVGGATELLDWAEERVRVQSNRAKARADRRRRERQEAAANAAAAAAAASAANSSTECGDGITAGPGTSCAFARNVKDAYYSVPGVTATVDVYSPTTNRTYSMYCTPVSGNVRCTGGDSASVTF